MSTGHAPNANPNYLSRRSDPDIFRSGRSSLHPSSAALVGVGPHRNTRVVPVASTDIGHSTFTLCRPPTCRHHDHHRRLHRLEHRPHRSLLGHSVLGRRAPRMSSFVPRAPLRYRAPHRRESRGDVEPPPHGSTPVAFFLLGDQPSTQIRCLDQLRTSTVLHPGRRPRLQNANTSLSAGEQIPARSSTPHGCPLPQATVPIIVRLQTRPVASSL